MTSRAILVGALILASAPASAGPWQVSAFVQGAARGTDARSGGAGGGLGVAYRVNDAWSVDAWGSESFYGGPQQSVGDLVLGTRWEPGPDEGWRWGLFGGFAHSHGADRAILEDAPFKVLAAIDERLNHRTGLHGGALLTRPLGTSGKMREFLRLASTSYPDGDPQPWTWSLGAGIEIRL